MRMNSVFAWVIDWLWKINGCDCAPMADDEPDDPDDPESVELYIPYVAATRPRAARWIGLVCDDIWMTKTDKKTGHTTVVDHPLE